MELLQRCHFDLLLCLISFACVVWRLSHATGHLYSVHTRFLSEIEKRRSHICWELWGRLGTRSGRQLLYISTWFAVNSSVEYFDNDIFFFAIYFSFQCFSSLPFLPTPPAAWHDERRVMYLLVCGEYMWYGISLSDGWICWCGIGQHFGWYDVWPRIADDFSVLPLI